MNFTKYEKERLRDIEDRLVQFVKNGVNVQEWNDTFLLGIIRKLRGKK